MAKGPEVTLGGEQVRLISVNVFGGITVCDAVVDGIPEAPEVPGDQAARLIVVRLDSNRVEEGRVIISAANHPLIHVVETMDEAARTAAELAAAK